MFVTFNSSSYNFKFLQFQTVMIAGQDRPSREFAKKMLKELCGNVSAFQSSNMITDS